MTDTEITDLTYSDFQSDARGSDIANLAHLPPISDETYVALFPIEFRRILIQCLMFIASTSFSQSLRYGRTGAVIHAILSHAHT